MNLREKILESQDLPVEKVPCPEWGCDVWIRTLSGVERDQFEESCLVQRGKKKEANMRNARAKLVCLAAVDESGKQIFGPADHDNLGSKSSKVLDRLFGVASRLAGISQTDMEDLVKNSESGPNEGSGSN
jgi:hypothetical protein